jgi:DNA-binding phage protein
MIYNRKERDKYIIEKVEGAPKRVKGTVVARLEEQTGLSRSQIYRIVQKKRS